MRQSETQIPDRPDQTSFLSKWYDWHRGYRIIRHDDGREERQALVGENLADMEPGNLPRTAHELRNGLFLNEEEEAREREAQQMLDDESRLDYEALIAGVPEEDRLFDIEEFRQTMSSTATTISSNLREPGFIYHQPGSVSANEAGALDLSSQPRPFTANTAAHMSSTTPPPALDTAPSSIIETRSPTIFIGTSVPSYNTPAGVDPLLYATSEQLAPDSSVSAPNNTGSDLSPRVAALQSTTQRVADALLAVRDQLPEDTRSLIDHLRGGLEDFRNAIAPLAFQNHPFRSTSSNNTAPVMDVASDRDIRQAAAVAGRLEEVRQRNEHPGVQQLDLEDICDTLYRVFTHLNVNCYPLITRLISLLRQEADQTAHLALQNITSYEAARARLSSSAARKASRTLLRLLNGHRGNTALGTREDIQNADYISPVTGMFAMNYHDTTPRGPSNLSSSDIRPFLNVASHPLTAEESVRIEPRTDLHNISNPDMLAVGANAMYGQERFRTTVADLNAERTHSQGDSISAQPPQSASSRLAQTSADSHQDGLSRLSQIARSIRAPHSDGTALQSDSFSDIRGSRPQRELVPPISWTSIPERDLPSQYSYTSRDRRTEHSSRHLLNEGAVVHQEALSRAFGVDRSWYDDPATVHQYLNNRQHLPPPSRRRGANPHHPVAPPETEVITLDSNQERPAAIEEDKDFWMKLECKICFTQVSDVALLPCGHLAICRWCADVVTPLHADKISVKRGHLCPICRRGIKKRVCILFHAVSLLDKSRPPLHSLSNALNVRHVGSSSHGTTYRPLLPRLFRKDPHSSSQANVNLVQSFRSRTEYELQAKG